MVGRCVDCGEWAHPAIPLLTGELALRCWDCAQKRMQKQALPLSVVVQRLMKMPQRSVKHCDVLPKVVNGLN